eukprot:scaffold22577_cov122-Cylindrotheca_fusiformis.AAC.20
MTIVEKSDMLEDFRQVETQTNSEHIEMLPLTGTYVKADGENDENVVEEYKSWNFQDWLYPPQLPRTCQLLRKENIAIPACYLLVGILQGLIGPLINTYPLDLGATEAQYSTLSSLKSLPATFKLAFGFLSDNFPVAGYRRKSYMLLGWSLAALSMGSLVLFSDLSLEKEEYLDENGVSRERNIAPENAPSIPFLSLATLLFGTGFWLADVMGDSVVAEKAKFETSGAGSIQSTCYAYRFFGVMCAAPLSTSLYGMLGPYYVISLLAVLPLSILPLVFHLGEDRYAPVPSTIEQCQEIWNTVCSRAVWQPLGFVYFYNVLQVGNAAWKEFLKTTLGFTSVSRLFCTAAAHIRNLSLISSSNED